MTTLQPASQQQDAEARPGRRRRRRDDAIDIESAKRAAGGENEPVVIGADPERTAAAGARETAGEQSGPDRNPAAALSRPGITQLIDVEETVRRLLVAAAPNAGRDDRLRPNDPDSPFVLRGLSQREPNPEYAAMTERRRALEAQAEFIRRQRAEYDRLFYGRALSEPDGRDIDEERLRFLEEFRPPRALTLATPFREAARITALWRTTLGDRLGVLFGKYADATKATNSPKAVALLDYHVRPAIDRYRSELAVAQFDDMPLTSELLKQYFNEYFRIALVRTLNPPAPGDEVVADDEMSATMSEMGSLGNLFRADRRDEVSLLVYYSSCLAQYASRQYRLWWSDLRAELKKEQDVDNNKEFEKALETLDRAVAELIKQADRAQKSNSGYVRASRLLSFADYANSYERLVFLDIAHRRATRLLTDEALETVFYNAIYNGEDANSAMLNLPVTAYEIRNSVVLGIPAEQYAALASRVDALDTALASVWPQGEARVYHAPADDASGTWSPYNLTHPLAAGPTAERSVDIGREYAQLQPLFDTEGAHENARARRHAFETLYANYRLSVELSQVNYLLNNALAPTVERPLRIMHAVYNTDLVELSVSVELAPQLEAKLAYVEPERRNAAGFKYGETGSVLAGGALIQSDAVAAEALKKLYATRFAVRWFHRPLVGDERQIAESFVGGGMPAVLQLGLSRSRAPEAVLSIAGVYRAEAFALDENDAPVSQYASQFAATVTVVAQCVRDEAVFTPVLGENGAACHRECRWCAPPPDAEQMQKTTALKALVTRGVAAYEEARRARPEDAKDFLDAPTPAKLAALAQQTPEQRRALFGIREIVAQFVSRLKPAQLAEAGFRDDALLDAEMAALPSLIAALNSPAARKLQSARERRFFDKVESDYIAFRRTYRTHSARISGVLIQPDPCANLALEKYFDGSFDDEMSTVTARQCLVLAHNVGYSVPSALFRDDQGEALLEHLLSTYDSRDTLLAAQPESWYGSHSFASRHPPLAELGQSRARRADANDLPQRLVLLARGGEPIDRGYDYQGLHAKIENELTLFRKAADKEEARAAYDAARTAVTVYNYFAFLAPAMARGVYMRADEIQSRVDAGAYVGLVFPPTPATEVD